jgi:macrodomain Ter protein organizer (MatP/YcbG family)
MAILKVEKFEAYSLKDALDQFPEGTGVVFPDSGANCTIAWQKAGCPTGIDLEKFMEEQLEKKCKDEENVSLYIIENYGKENKRTRPYSMKNIPTKARHYVKHYVIVIGGQLHPHYYKQKSDAIKALRDLYFNGAKEDAYIMPIKIDVNNLKTLECKYTPSKGTQKGAYTFFRFVG